MVINKRELKSKADMYLSTRAKEKRLKELDARISQEIISNHNFLAEGSNKKIIKGEDAYLMNDTDFDKFLELKYQEEKKYNVNKGNKNNYCYYEYTKERKKIENELLKFWDELYKSEYPYTWVYNFERLSSIKNKKYSTLQELIEIIIEFIKEI